MSHGVAVAAAVRPRWEDVVLRILLTLGGVSLCLGVVFNLALSALSGL